jgi:hypothetical protein
MKLAIHMSAVAVLSCLCFAAHANKEAANAVLANNQPTSVIVHTGVDALRTELLVLAQLIADTTDRVVAGEEKSAELNTLLERQSMLQKALQSPTPSDQQSATLNGCGQSVNLYARAAGSPGGSMYTNAIATVTLNSGTPAIVEGVLYTIAKENFISPPQRLSNYKYFRFNSEKLGSGTFSASSNSIGQFSFGFCGKAFAQAIISNGSGDPLTCNTVPLLVEASWSSALNNCDSAN